MITEEQVCIAATPSLATAAPTIVVVNDSQNIGLCHFCYSSNCKVMPDLDSGTSICIPCTVGIKDIRK